MTTTDETTQCKNAASLSKKTLKLCTQPSVMVFLLSAFIGGLVNCLYLNFTFKYLVDVMQRSKSQSSVVFTITAVASCIMFVCSRYLMQLFRGTFPTMVVSLLAACVRLLIISMDIPFEVFLAVHLLQGFTFALFYSALMEHVQDISPPDINMTMSNITLSIFFYIGSLVGNIGGSEVYEEYGGKKLFLGMSLVCGVWAVLMFVFYIRPKIVRRRQQPVDSSINGGFSA